MRSGALHIRSTTPKLAVDNKTGSTRMDGPAGQPPRIARPQFPRPPLKEEIMRIHALTRGAWALLTVTAAAMTSTAAPAQTGDVQQDGGPRRCPSYPPPSCVCPEPSPSAAPPAAV